MSEGARCEPEVPQSRQKTVVALTELRAASCPLHGKWFPCPCTMGCCVAAGGHAAAALHAASSPTVGQIPADLSGFPTSSHKQQPHGRLWRQLGAWDLCIASILPFILRTSQLRKQLSIRSSVIAVSAQTCWALYTSDRSWVLQSQWELQVWSVCFSASLLLVTSEDTGQLQPHQRRGVEVIYTNLATLEKHKW